MRSDYYLQITTMRWQTQKCKTLLEEKVQEGYVTKKNRIRKLLTIIII